MRNSSILRTVLPLILPLYLPSLIFSLSQSMLIPVLPLYVKSFEVSYGLIGLVLAGESIGMLIGDIPSGIIMRHLGEKRIILLGIGLVAISTSALFKAQTIPEAFFYRLVAGLGTSFYSVARHTIIADLVPTVNRGRAIAFFGGVFRIGRFGGPIIGGTIASAYGLRAPFIFFGAAYMIALINVALSMPKLERAENSTNRNSTYKKGQLGATLKSQYKVLSSAGAGSLLMQMVRSTQMIIIPLYAADILGLDVKTIGLILSLSSSVDMTLFIPAGIIMDRLGRKYAIVSSLFFLTIGISLISFTTNFTTLMLVGLLLGFGSGLGSGAMMTLGADLAPEESRGEFLGIWRLLGDSGGTGGPLAVGAIADIFSLQATTWVISGVGLGAIIIFTFLVKETLSKRQHPISNP
ncbi:MAG: MFS transporter [Anaerolineaceae bacterium]|nr:MFS transporter [Anaerolineaceae bacterium]